MKTKTFKWLGVLLIGLTGCYDFSNFNNIVIDPIKTSFVFPVINDSIAIRQILEKSDSIKYLQENVDHSYSILFRDTVDSGHAADQFSIPNQNFNYNLTIPAVPPIPIPNQTFPFDEESQNSIQTTTEAGGTVELKGIDFSGGTIQIHMVNNFHQIVKGTVTFSSLIKSPNDTLKLKFDLSTYGSTKDTTINLSDYHLNSYHASTSEYNYFYYRVKGTLTTTNNSVGAGDNIAIQVSAISPVFSRITGKINYSFVQSDQSFNVDIFPSNITVQQHLEDPKISLKFVNSFGIPLSANFTSFKIDNKQGLPFDLSSSRSNVDDLQIPNKSNSIPGIKRVNQADTTITYKINRDNSNISLAFDNTPTSVNFGGKFDLGDNTANHDFFINHQSKIMLISEAEIPIYGWVMISMTDSIMNLNLPKLDSIKNLEVNSADIKFNLKIQNSIPFGIYFQVAFINQAAHDTTKLFENKTEEVLIQSPTVGVDGTSNQIASKTTVINIDKARYESISKATKAKIYLRFALGSTTQSVKVLSTDKLRIKANFYISGIVKPKL